MNHRYIQRGEDQPGVDLGVGSIKSTQVDLGLGQVGLCSSVAVEIFWRRRSHYKSFQVDLRSRLNQ